MTTALNAAWLFPSSFKALCQCLCVSCNWEKEPCGLLRACLACWGCWTGNVHAACCFHYLSLNSLMFGTEQGIPDASQGWAFPLGKLVLSVLSTASSQNSWFQIHYHFCSWCIGLELSRASLKKCLGDTSGLSGERFIAGLWMQRKYQVASPSRSWSILAPWGSDVFPICCSTSSFFFCFDRYKLP